MARVLLVEDDLVQLEMRGLVFEAEGHTVERAASAAVALERATAIAPDVVVMDLRLPDSASGVALIDGLTAECPGVPVIVLSGGPEPPERRIAAYFTKPFSTRRLMETVAKLCLTKLGAMLLLALAARGAEFTLKLDGEAVAEIEMRAPGADFAIAGREAAIAAIRVDGLPVHHLVVANADKLQKYSVFLGRLKAGPHQIAVERDAALSAAGARLEVKSVKAQGAEAVAMLLRHAPILHARADTIGKFSDVPLLMYAEKLEDEAGKPFLQYTVIFSNEDGGTDTVALMARWGRTTDIEHVYRVWIDGPGNAVRAMIQAKDHQEVEFTGQKEGDHPLLVPVTLNNMVAPGISPMRFQLTPMEPDLKKRSREYVMDQNPWTYALAAKELEREGKAKLIRDPRNYLYIEAEIANHHSRIAFRAKLKSEDIWRTSHTAEPRRAIERDGWVRTTIELPPTTSAKQIGELSVECIPVRPDAVCRIDGISQMFFLTPDFRPGRTFGKVDLRPGGSSFRPGMPLALPVK